MDLQWITTFYNDMTGAVGVVYLGFSKAFTTVSHNMRREGFGETLWWPFSI